MCLFNQTHARLPPCYHKQPTLNKQTLLTTMKLLLLQVLSRGGTPTASLTSAMRMISTIRASAALVPAHTHTHTHTDFMIALQTLMQINWWHVLGKAMINVWVEVGQLNGVQSLKTPEGDVSIRKLRARWGSRGKEDSRWAFLIFAES